MKSMARCSADIPGAEKTTTDLMKLSMPGSQQGLLEIMSTGGYSLAWGTLRFVLEAHRKLEISCICLGSLADRLAVFLHLTFLFCVPDKRCFFTCTIASKVLKHPKILFFVAHLAYVHSQSKLRCPVPFQLHPPNSRGPFNVWGLVQLLGTTHLQWSPQNRVQAAAA